MLAGAVRGSFRNWRFTPNLPPKRIVPGAPAATVRSGGRLVHGQGRTEQASTRVVPSVPDTV